MPVRPMVPVLRGLHIDPNIATPLEWLCSLLYSLGVVLETIWLLLLALHQLTAAEN